MTDFKPAYPDTVNLDPHKRVYYSHGLVLGVDEFLQEETYLLERDRTHNRGLHGYGTVCGLSLDTRDDGGQPVPAWRWMRGVARCGCPRRSVRVWTTGCCAITTTWWVCSVPRRVLHLRSSH